MRRRSLALAMAAMAAVAALAAACDMEGDTDGEARVERFVLEYRTGTIPPPYNYAYRVEGARQEGGDLDVTYELTYRYRDEISGEELEAQGYSADDDIEWSTTLAGAEADAWLDLAAATELLEDPDEPPPGADYISVTLVFADGTERSGEPLNRDEWEALAAELDVRAREALDHPRSEP